MGCLGGQMQSRLSLRKYSLTMRSSSEWKEMIASLPPDFRAATACGSTFSTRSSSWLTAMRRAWNVCVAGWMRFVLSLSKGRTDYRLDHGSKLTGGAKRSRLDDGLRDAPGSAFFPVLVDQVGQFILRQVLTRSAAVVGAAGSKRMSSGASCWKEKPRSGVSSCIEERPRSSRMPSTSSQPISRSLSRENRRRPASDGRARRKEPRSHVRALTPAGRHPSPTDVRLVRRPPIFRGHDRPRPVCRLRKALRFWAATRV
jgi:hypothetical protein